VEDYYKILGVIRTASQDDIKKAYRGLVKKFHPDSNPGDKKAEEHFKKINEAYNTLSDDGRKAEYDKKILGAGTPNDAFGTNKDSNVRADGGAKISREDFDRTSTIFGDYFGFNPKTKEHNLKHNGKDVKAMKTKDAFEAVFGKKRF